MNTAESLEQLEAQRQAVLAEQAVNNATETADKQAKKRARDNEDAKEFGIKLAQQEYRHAIYSHVFRPALTELMDALNVLGVRNTPEGEQPRKWEFAEVDCHFKSRTIQGKAIVRKTKDTPRTAYKKTYRFFYEPVQDHYVDYDMIFAGDLSGTVKVCYCKGHGFVKADSKKPKPGEPIKGISPEYATLISVDPFKLSDTAPVTVMADVTKIRDPKSLEHVELMGRLQQALVSVVSDLPEFAILKAKK